MSSVWTSSDFESHFELLTSHVPFPWQQRLFNEFLQRQIPKSCDIPTGLGKTAVIPIWLLALAHHSTANTRTAFPRRLVYVVNRRTVVDQATREVERLRATLLSTAALQVVAETLSSLAVRRPALPLAISTLRGAFADNAEWRDDPARPAVIVGTVDMVGSRLLFSSYGRGFRSRPLHAAFLGQDVLIVHDEAHLEPAFQALVEALETEQERSGDLRQLRVMALTATSRHGDLACGLHLCLDEDDRSSEVVKTRIDAKKGVSFFPVDDEKQTADVVLEHALQHRDSEQTILIFLRRLEDVSKVAERIGKLGLQHQLLTGTLRGLERDALAQSDPIFARFLHDSDAPRCPGTVYLVCTSAGEVGVNIWLFRHSGGNEPGPHRGTGQGRRGGSRWPGGNAHGCESPRPVS